MSASKPHFMRTLTRSYLRPFCLLILMLLCASSVCHRMYILISPSSVIFSMLHLLSIPYFLHHNYTPYYVLFPNTFLILNRESSVYPLLSSSFPKICSNYFKIITSIVQTVLFYILKFSFNSWLVRSFSLLNSQNSYSLL